MNAARVARWASEEAWLSAARSGTVLGILPARGDVGAGGAMRVGASGTSGVGFITVLKRGDHSIDYANALYYTGAVCAVDQYRKKRG